MDIREKVSKYGWAVLADPKVHKRKNVLITKDMYLYGNSESDLEFIERYEKNATKKKDTIKEKSEADEENSSESSKQESC